MRDGGLLEVMVSMELRGQDQTRQVDENLDTI